MDWLQQGQDIDGVADYDRFGFSVALSRDGISLAVGGVRNDVGATDAGHVRVFSYQSGTSWDQVGSDIYGNAADDWAGYSVSLSDNGMVVALGAPSEKKANEGYVRVYSFDSGTSWQQMGGDIVGEATGDWNGCAVSLSADGTIVAIGALYRSPSGISNAGYVRVFEFNSGTSSWDKLGQDIVGEAAADYSGWSVALSADGINVAIGAPYNDPATLSAAGHARVYSFESGTSWQQKGDDIDGEVANEFCGFFVSLSGDGEVLAVGCRNYDNQMGRVRVFSYAGGWTQMKRYFGRSSK